MNVYVRSSLTRVCVYMRSVCVRVCERARVFMSSPIGNVHSARHSSMKCVLKTTLATLPTTPRPSREAFKTDCGSHERTSSVSKTHYIFSLSYPLCLMSRLAPGWGSTVSAFQLSCYLFVWLL